MIKLFISDLDHTLLNEQKQVDDAVEKAIQEMIETGVDIGLASGRVDKEIQEVGLRFLNYACHRISENGVFVFTADGKKLFSTAMPHEVALQIIDKAKSYPILPIFNVNNQCHVLKKTEEIVEYETSTKIRINETPDLLAQLGESLTLTKISFIGELSQLKQFEHAIQQEYTGKVNFHISSPNCFDVVPLHTSKGSGLQILMDHLGLKADEVACVGDSYNDISLFKTTKHSFAMKHGEKKVRDSANYTVSSVREVVDYILHYNYQQIYR